MTNYDDDILGVGNSQHPANEKETEVFQSEDLQECLDYYKDTGDSVPSKTLFSTRKSLKNES